MRKTLITFIKEEKSYILLLIINGLLLRLLGLDGWQLLIAQLWFAISWIYISTKACQAMIKRRHQISLKEE